ncbi:tRNA (adenosine(37)-N6)-threonylcarbamoyltransferase complex transferase subunit TsaD [Patescibacteria group bacterium]|nr:tRNA (adenosine(37)-N6)-threonylcarbamoyltransferase complex transferase subunit TsaD [Patescibacteria group bacterium]
MKILALETSCDETAAAIVEDGVKEVCSVVASSREFHEETGGIVPEVAARKQVEFIIPVLDNIVKKFSDKADTNTSIDYARENIDMLAVTVGPGLIGSLLVGVEAAKALSLAWEKSLIPVNHLVGHIYANWVDAEDLPEFPSLALVVSGGHTDLVLMGGHGDLIYLGGTLDDAVGEAFDKTARLLGLSKYLGGPELSRLASTCKDNKAIGVLPRPLLDSDKYDLSFSGLKTAVKRLIEKDIYPPDVIACEFENAVVDVLVSKSIKAAKEYKVKSLLLGGGVSANLQLRTRIKNEAANIGVKTHIPPLHLCTDNAVYIASAAYFNNHPRNLSEIDADSSLGIIDIV